MTPLQTYIKETEKEFEEKFFNDETDLKNWMLKQSTQRPEQLDFLHERQIGLVEVVKGLVPKDKYRISWDIADGNEWCVLIWKVKEDNTLELYQELSKKSDDGGSFDLPDCRSQILKNLEK